MSKGIKSYKIVKNQNTKSTQKNCSEYFKILPKRHLYKFGPTGLLDYCKVGRSVASEYYGYAIRIPSNLGYNFSYWAKYRREVHD